MRFSRLAAIAGASVLVVGIASCSAPGASPRKAAGAWAAAPPTPPRMTIAMITHEVPGDSFWDLIRKGAETAAKKDNIELRYSNDPEAPDQANLVQTAVDSGVKGIAVTLAKPDAMQAAVKAAEAKGIPVVAFNAGLEATGRRWASRSTSARTVSSPARARATASPRRAPRRRSASSRSRATSTSRLAAPAEEHIRRHREPQCQR